MIDANCYCLDCQDVTFHENRLCTECYSRRFNDPARQLPNGEIRVLGDPPNLPVEPDPKHRRRLIDRFWDKIALGHDVAIRQAALALQDRGINLRPVLLEHLMRIEVTAHRHARLVALGVFH